MSKASQREASQAQAQYMKDKGICRTMGRCALCYRLITIDSWKSKYKHVCHN